MSSINVTSHSEWRALCNALFCGSGCATCHLRIGHVHVHVYVSERFARVTLCEKRGRVEFLFLCGSRRIDKAQVLSAVPFRRKWRFITRRSLANGGH